MYIYICVYYVFPGGRGRSSSGALDFLSEDGQEGKFFGEVTLL